MPLFLKESDPSRGSLDTLSEDLLDRIAADLVSRGYSEIPNLIGESCVDALRSEAQDLRDQGRLLPASVGRSEGRALAQDQRNDSTCWWEETPQTEAQMQVWHRWSQIAHGLNQRLFLGLTHFEAHWAIYPTGGFYRKHVDRFRDHDARVLSAVLYLNPKDWKLEDGGALRLWPRTSPSLPVDLLPEAGKWVLFLSDEIPHEVRTTNRERISIAAWLKRTELAPPFMKLEQ